MSAEGVRYTNRSVWLSAFRKCMGRVPSDEKIPDDMSDEDKCTVVCTLMGTLATGQGNIMRYRTLGPKVYPIHALINTVLVPYGVAQDAAEPEATPTGSTGGEHHDARRWQYQ